MSWHEIVKYRPEYYDENGAYKANEWTSISDIGKFYDGKIFTLENYLRVEQRYIAVILSIMSRMDCKYLTVEYLEVDKNDIEKHINSTKDHTTDSLLVTSLIQLEQGKRIYYKNIDNVIRLALREYIYIVLCNKQKKLKIEFGYDYYLYVLCNLDNRILNNLVNSVGLYLDPRG